MRLRAQRQGVSQEKETQAQNENKNKKAVLINICFQRPSGMSRRIRQQGRIYSHHFHRLFPARFNWF
jgi:hypothetical protein